MKEKRLTKILENVSTWFQGFLFPGKKDERKEKECNHKFEKIYIGVKTLGWPCHVELTYIRKCRKCGYYDRKEKTEEKPSRYDFNSDEFRRNPGFFK